jgi:hypothetical protein
MVAKYHSRSKKTTLFGQKQLNLEVTVWNTAKVLRESAFPSVVRKGTSKPQKRLVGFKGLKDIFVLDHL